VLHVTSETFGAIQKLKVIHIKRKPVLFRRPKVRQYFLDDVLHRAGEERKVGWDELFVDLIYVGAIAKAAHLVSAYQTWESFGHLTLVLVLVLQHWKAFCHYNNVFYHEDVFLKVNVHYTIHSSSLYKDKCIAGDVCGDGRYHRNGHCH
jgi:Bacterial low temperature requirement A protein (LtrA)